jgi:hypothetical protein
MNETIINLQALLLRRRFTDHRFFESKFNGLLIVI